MAAKQPPKLGFFLNKWLHLWAPERNPPLPTQLLWTLRLGQGRGQGIQSNEHSTPGVHLLQVLDPALIFLSVT